MAENTKLIAIIPGDGIGPEVIAQATRVLELYRDRRGLPLVLWPLDLGADRYLRDGTTYPAEVHARIASQASAVLLGALGDPRVPGLEHARDILFGLRFGLDLYANVRPVRALADRLVPLKDRGAKEVDLVVFRENTEGIYVGLGGQFKRGTRDEVAINEDVNTRKGVERLIVAGFAHARAHGKRRVHMVDKSNAMKHAHELWYRVFFEVAKGYPDIEARHLYIDAMCLLLILDGCAVRGRRDMQPVRRHRDRPRRRVAGWAGDGGERQPAPAGSALLRRRARRCARGHVRAGPRLRAPAGGEGRGQPAGERALPWA